MSAANLAVGIHLHMLVISLFDIPLSNRKLD